VSLTLPRLARSLRIVNPDGTPNIQMIQWWHAVATATEQNDADNDALDASQDEALDVLNDLVPKINAAYELVGPGAYAFTASATLPEDCRTAIVDTTAGAVTLTLLPVADCLSDVTVKKTNAGANNVVIEGDGSETIDGAANLTFNTQYASRTVRPALGAWHLVASV
jgi:hypothetical protein